MCKDYKIKIEYDDVVKVFTNKDDVYSYCYAMEEKNIPKEEIMFFVAFIRRMRYRELTGPLDLLCSFVADNWDNLKYSPKPPEELKYEFFEYIEGIL